MLTYAYKFMMYDKTKSLGILFGIIISVFLMGQQLGIFSAMLNNMKGLASNDQEYIWVVSESTLNANQLVSMDSRIGRELFSVPHVTDVNALVVAGGTAKFSDGNKINIILVGSEGPDFIGGPQVLLDGASSDLLANSGAIFLNDSDKPSIPRDGKTGTFFEINNQRVYIAGYTTGRTGFGSSYMFTTIERARQLGSISPNKASVYLIESDTSVSQAAVVNYINENIPLVTAYRGKDFADKTQSYMLATNNIAVSFGMMVVFALVAGFVIVGLTLYSSVNERIKDYGTIKAIGGDNMTISKLILFQSIIYGVVGFTIAFALLWGFKLLTGDGKLEISYGPLLIMFLTAVTLFISVIGSVFALRKILKLEPVQIFRM